MMDEWPPGGGSLFDFGSAWNACCFFPFFRGTPKLTFLTFWTRIPTLEHNRRFLAPLSTRT
jgi:hypothetical protein